MRLTTETPRVRWTVLTCVWLIVLVLATLDTFAMRDYVDLLKDSGNVPSSELPLQRTGPADYSDAQTWTRYAIYVQETGMARLRHTDIDNAPVGRDVHWNSAFVQLLATAGRLQRTFTGQSIEAATEQVVVWFNLPLFVGFVTLASALVARRSGAAAGVLIALGFVGYRSFYDGFVPGNVDHHGVLTAAVWGLVAGALYMGAGWNSPRGSSSSPLPASAEAGRRGALLSAIAGAIGLWVSAASVIPMLFAVGASGAVAGLLLGPAALRQGATFEPMYWRLWGRVGGSLALLAYAIEYLPSHFGMRLEVNHPLYAIAWVGGGELIADVLSWRLSGNRLQTVRVGVCVLTVCAPGLVMLSLGSAAFSPLDPATQYLHSRIQEFLSLRGVVNEFGAAVLLRYTLGFLLLLPCITVATKKPDARLLALFASLPVASGFALAAWQVRWWQVLSAAQLCLLPLGLFILLARTRDRTRWYVVSAIGLLFVHQACLRIMTTRGNVRDGAVTEADATRPLYRDIAATIQASLPDSTITLLSSPTASSGIAYYGQFHSIASLYWENMAGIRAAAAIFSEQGDDEVRLQLRRRRVTHIVVLSTDTFLAEYATLARNGSSTTSSSDSFGTRLAREMYPLWLRPIPFRPRGGVLPSTLIVHVLKVVEPQKPIEALQALAAAQLGRGDWISADSTLHRAVRLAPLSQRASLYIEAASLAYEGRAHALALSLFQSALQLEPNTGVDAAVAWLLATSSDSTLRNGDNALIIAQRLYRADPRDPVAADALAAALAEVGRFPEAAEIAAQLLANAQGGDTPRTRILEARWRSYQLRRPWRQ